MTPTITATPPRTLEIQGKAEVGLEHKGQGGNSNHGALANTARDRMETIKRQEAWVGENAPSM
jgi:hypothetical protein